MSRIQSGLTDVYNPGYGAGRNIRGRGIIDTIKRGIKFAKDNQLASKALTAANALGLTDRISQNKFGNLALMGLTKAQENGFGRRKRKGSRKGGKTIKLVIVSRPRTAGRRKRRSRRSRH